ncbi:MAG: tetratricopeptide repeat protein [Pseudolysinimonas sp.]
MNSYWDFGDPVASERRFREAAKSATTANPAEASRMTTQIARAVGLQQRYPEAHAILDGLEAVGGIAGGADPELAVRIELERGRLLRSAGDPDAAGPHFTAAADRAEGFDGLRVDALHMLALVVPIEQQVAAHERALALASSSSDPDAQRWVPSLLNNLGMTYSELEDWPAALRVFERALAIRQQGDDTEATRIAKWMIGWTLRNLGRREERTIQRALKAELDALGEDDPYVVEELELLDPPPP